MRISQPAVRNVVNTQGSRNEGAIARDVSGQPARVAGDAVQRSAAAKHATKGFPRHEYEVASVHKLEMLAASEPMLRMQSGKKFQVTGELFFSKRFNDKLLNFNYYTSIGTWVTVDKRAFLVPGASELFRKKIGAKGWSDPKPTATAYVTVQPPGSKLAFKLDAIQRPDGKLVTL
jgi:hypothetical protein